jgi:membrane protease YdiL (CAAX protease family)
VSGRLWAWIVFVSLFGAVNYATYFGTSSSTRSDRNVLYHYSTAGGSALVYAVLLGITLAIAVGTRWRELFALVRPRSLTGALWRAVVLLVGVYVLTGILTPFLHPGKEQGLTPTRWEPSHAGAYAANFVVVAGVAPVVEELIFRGMGYALLERYGRRLAIVVVGIAFGLAHGLVDALPLLAAFGIGLAWLRSRTGSVYPGMALHAAFNAIALVIAVTT